MIFSAIVSVGLVSPESPVGTRPRPVSGDADLQWVIKRGVETWPKKGGVSTPGLKWYLIINKLQNTPWPRPATRRIIVSGDTCLVFLTGDPGAMN